MNGVPGIFCLSRVWWLGPALAEPGRGTRFVCEEKQVLRCAQDDNASITTMLSHDDSAFDNDNASITTAMNETASDALRS